MNAPPQNPAAVDPPARCVVAQKGAREHFLTARALQRRGMLAALVVDGWTPAWMRRGPLAAALRATGLARWLGAWTPDVPDDKVRSLTRYGLWRRAVERRARRRGDTAIFLKTDAGFAQRVARLRLPPHDVFFGFAYASLEALAAARARGVLTVLDQIDPGQAEVAIVRAAGERWPEARPQRRDDQPEAAYARNRREWALADVIVVNSEWTASLLVDQGAPASRIRLLPLAYEPPAPLPRTDPPPPPPFRVLWLGLAGLRKGMPVLLEAARRIGDLPVVFDIVGPVDLAPAAVAAAPPSIRWHGPVARAAAATWYRQAHLFVLPTLSDGFAITQLEAMAHGVPVVATPNCARVVEDGVSGFIVPAGDAAALAAVVRRCALNPARGAAMREACRQRAARFSVAAYADRLAEILAEILAAARRDARPNTVNREIRS